MEYKLNSKFLFRCQDCDMLLTVDFEKSDEIDKVNNDDIELECPCGGLCLVLRD